MSADAISIPPPTNSASDSKSSRKKKVKGESAVANITPAPASDIRPDTPSQDAKLNGADGGLETPYVKELQKNIRNVNKKLASMHKLDAIIAEHPDLSLDDLVVTRKINNDQKAQALKKPALQAQLAQFEEQVAQYKKFDQEYQNRLATEKDLLESAHKAELLKLRETIKSEAAIEAQKAFKQRLLVLSRFLRAAAARRQREDDESEETKAFEGALLLLYGGDPSAVVAAENLIDGAEESVPSTEGTLLNITYAQVKRSALEEAPFAAEEAWANDVAAADPIPPESHETAAGTDPTVAHAGLTEKDDITQIPNGTALSEEPSAPEPPAVASTGDEAANAAAESQWDSKPVDQDPLAESYEIIPSNPTETASPDQQAATVGTQSWADDTPTELETSTPVTNGNDGFHQVHHRGGRGRGGPQGDSRGGFRGRGRGGDGRGRGRGGFRGDRGAPRGNFRGNRGREGNQS